MTIPAYDIRTKMLAFTLTNADQEARIPSAMASLPLHLPSHSPLPAAYHGPRGELLLELKRAGHLTARDLATKLGLSLNAVRHHLKELEAEGVVTSRRGQR